MTVPGAAAAAPSHETVARDAVARLRHSTLGSGALAQACQVSAAYLDAALAPLVDAGKLMRISAFRNGAAEFDYRWSAIWVPKPQDFTACRGVGAAPEPAISPVAPPAPGRLEHRGAGRVAARAHALRPVLRDDQMASGKSGARSKAARDTLERAFVQTPQSLGWAPTPAPAIPTDQESTMSTAIRKPRPLKADSARFQICALLVAKGDLTREELLANVSAERTAFNNALFNAKAAGHITFLEKPAKYHITSQGKAWTGGKAPSAPVAPDARIDIKVPNVPLKLDARDLVCALNSRGELALDLGDEVLIKFKPRQALVLTRFLAGTTVLEQMAQRGEL